MRKVLNKDSVYIKKFGFKNIEPTIEFDIETERVAVNVKLTSALFLDELEKLSDSLLKRFSKDSIKYSFDSFDSSSKESIDIAIDILIFEYPFAKALLSSREIDIDESDKKATLKVGILALQNQERFFPQLRKILKGISSIDIDIAESGEEVKEPCLKEEIEKREKALPKERKTKKSILGGKAIGKPNTNEELDNLDFKDSAVLEGEVFNFNCIQRGKIYIHTFNINLLNIGYTLKYIGREMLSLKDGNYVKIKAIKEEDNFYKGETIFVAKDIELIDRKEKKKDVGEKRVEFNLSSKMSDMRSIVDISEAVKRSAAYGYDSLALTDRGVVYGYPDLHKYSSKIEGFKAIYGINANIVDNMQVIFNHNIDEFIAFDLETTGFSPYSHKIIEIGAVKVKNGNIVDRFQSFVNPQESIPDKIIQLTGITNIMVEKAPLIDEVLPKFLKFVEGSLLVAHNAEFDMSFISVKSKMLNLEFNNECIDTLEIARAMLTEKKKHGLKELAKEYGLEFRHHRAIYDSEVTANVLLRLNPKEILYKNIKNSYPYNMLIYAKNLKGLKAIYEMVSLSHLQNFKRIPKIPKHFVEKYREDLILGAAFNSGELSNAYSRGAKIDKLRELAKFYDFIEISPKECSDFLDREFSERDVEDLIKTLAEIDKDKLIVTSNTLYLDKGDNIFVEALDYSSNRKIRDRGCFFRTSKELTDSFPFLDRDLVERAVTSHTLDLADKFEVFQPIPKGFYPPVIDSAEDEIREITYRKMRSIYGDNEAVKERVDRELNSIIDNGFAVLYLISHKLVKKSLDDHYLVGSRGSVGSSVVAWMMDITEVNALPAHYVCSKCKNVEFTEYLASGVDLPKKECCNEEMIQDGHNIAFEVFMGFKGDKVPDIDLNFSGEYQANVHRYVEELFGKDNVFRAGTISTLASKNAFGYTKKYFEENNIEATKATIEIYAKKCENVRKTTGQHPGGMIIVPNDKSVYDFTPVQRPANDQKTETVTTHFDYHVMDEQLVKLDILGHDDPTTLKLLEQYTGIDPTTISLNDQKTLSIFNSPTSLGVESNLLNTASSGIPEFGTPFTKRMLMDTKPTKFSDLIKLSGLSHGTDVWSNNAQELIKKGTATLEEVISVRDEIMTYLISMGIDKNSSFKIMEFVRKGKPSKDPETWKGYVEIMKEHKVPDWYIESCTKIKYIFPKGHAAAYVLMAVRIAYFKVHHPLAFYAAYLTRKVDSVDLIRYVMNSSDKSLENILREYMGKKLDAKGKGEHYVWEILLEMNLRGIKLLPIDLYKSDSTKFLVEEDGVRAPFLSIKGLGGAVANKILEERDKPFRSIEDLRNRTKIPQTVCDKLKEVGILELQSLNQKQLF